MQRQGANVLPIHTPGLTLGVTHHQRRRHLMWKEVEEERDPLPLFTHITVASPASQDAS